MKTIESQNVKIKQWLLNGKSITAIEALNQFGCFRLASRISDLRQQDGLPICKEMVDNGEKRFAKYYLPQEYLNQLNTKQR